MAKLIVNGNEQGGGGSKLYFHHIVQGSMDDGLTLNIITQNSSPMTNQDVCDYIASKSGYASPFAASGYKSEGMIIYCYVTKNTPYFLRYKYFNGTRTGYDYSTSSITDIVTEV